MKKITMIFCIAAFFVACNNDKKAGETKTESDTSSAAKDAVADTSTTSMTMPDSATMMKNWQEYMTPGDMHKMMAKWDGTWNGDVTMWMYPDAPPTTSKSTAVNKMIMNGLYQESTHTGDMMGMPFNGKSIVAFDNHEKQFISTWIDNMGSGVMVLKGPWDEATKSITLTGKMMDPGMKTQCDIREKFTIVDSNTHRMEMFVTMPGQKEMKTMNIDYKRK